MKQIVIQAGVDDASPRTTEVSLYPNVDAGYTMVNYAGDRLITRRSQCLGIKQAGLMQPNLQGVAVYGDLLVRMADGNTHYLYKISANGSLSAIGNFSLSAGHCNSLQFAPSLGADQSYPYLYSAYLQKKCSVLSISSSYEVSLVQTITIGNDVAGVPSDCNLQIGDDGYIWCAYMTDQSKCAFLKFRRVAVSEGNVTLGAADVLDRWESVEIYPYANYVHQGMKIYNGQIWWSHGMTGGTQERGIVVYDTRTHAFVTILDLTAVVPYELEDIEFWNNSVLLVTYAAQYYRMEF